MIHAVRWTARKLAQRVTLVESLVYRRQRALAPWRYQPLPDPLAPPPVAAGIDDSAWPLIEPHTHWGRRNLNFILRGSFNVPSGWAQANPVALYLPLGFAGDFSHPEALVYIDGLPFAACDRHHQEVILPASLCDGADHALALHGWTGLIPAGYPAGDPGLYMNPCAVVEVDQATRDFLATARVALGIAQNLDANSPVKGALLTALDAAFGEVDLREPIGDAFYASIPPTHARLRAALEQAGAPLDVAIVASGHAHIDVAWLWTLGQTRRKAGRTFHTVLRLMEQYPDYHFTQSQPQLYDYVRQDYPGLLEAITERVNEGRWEPIGGMWVEADCNLSGGESLARQFLLGRTFFRQHFGPDAEAPVLWLPDVFGYAWNLPQLIKQAGLKYFFTIKIGWSQYNRLPYDSFWWQGLDGTRVLTHFSTTPDESAYASTYNAMASPKQVLGTWTNFQQKELQDELLMAYGFGDGGGGPTREMIENIRELGHFPGAPRVRQGSVAEFFRRLEAESGERLPTWNGELYLELHRGTYTTQSRNKRANRQSEFLLHDAEFVAALAARLDPGYAYPHDTLRWAWQTVCLNQFHDIIPGSSIHDVYEESLAHYAEIRRQGEQVRAEALAALATQMGAGLLAVNPTGFARCDLAFFAGELPAGRQITRADGTPVAVQPTTGGAWLDLGELPPYSVTALRMVEGEITAPAPAAALRASPTLLENDRLRVELDAAGDITRIYDKANRREALPTGTFANQFLAFEDRPMDWDAWDLDIFYEDKCWTAAPATSVQVVEEGPLRATLEIRRRILNSSYVQRISLAHNAAQIDVDTTIDWRSRHVLLKVAFPVDVLSPTATFEVQWGNVERPTHRNTSWDWARFESCAHKWVDLSEGNYGASLLNDCKYGHDIQGNVIRLTLLRSPTYPDPEADQGEQRFAYSFLPHAGPWDQTTVAAAYALNDPLLVVQTGVAAEGEPRHVAPLVSTQAPNVVIETVKQAEDGRGLIVRLYECRRWRGPVVLTAGFDLTAAWRTNLLEENQAQLPIAGNETTFELKPYEIVTLRLA
jgi:alpha-mannosidase